MEASATSDDGDVAHRRNAESPVGVFVVADVRLHQDGLAEILRRQRTIRVLGTTADADEAVARARSLSPQVILVDMVMGDNAMRAVRTLAQEVPEAKTLALAVPEAEQEVIACVEAGAAGCLTREAPLEEVVSSIEGIARGEAPCSPLMIAAIFKRVRELAVGRPGLEERLTPREREILALIDEGLSNKQIAQSLCIETATVKNHVHSILEKLHVTRRGEAAAAVRHPIGMRDAFSCVIPLILCHALDEPFGLVLSGPWN